MKQLLIGLVAAAALAVIPSVSDAGQRGGGGNRGGGGAGRGAPGVQAGGPRANQERPAGYAALQARDRARDLERHAGEGASAAVLARDRDRVREQLHDLDAGYQRWHDGLSEPDRTRLRERVRDLEQQRDRLQERFRLLDAAVASPTLDREQVRTLARELARESEQWHSAWRVAQGRPPAQPK